MTSGRIIIEIKYLEVRDVPGSVTHVVTDPMFFPFEVPAEGMREVPAYINTEPVRIPESGIAAIRSVREEWPQVFGAIEENRRLRDALQKMEHDYRASRLRCFSLEERCLTAITHSRKEISRMCGWGLWERLKWALKSRRSKR
jgi:hypothetical protein